MKSPPNPLRPIDTAAAATLRGCFERARFTEAGLAERFDLPQLRHERETALAAALHNGEGSDLLWNLSGLFLAGLAVRHEAATRELLPHEWDALVNAGLVEPLTRDGDAWLAATVRLAPITHPDGSGTLLVAADRTDRIDGETREPFADFVFSGHNPLTRQFLDLLPRQASGSVLDIGTGTGVASLVVAPWATRVVGVDILQRSIEFARFNAALNDLTDVRFCQGDLYGPVDGERFDWIVAHPPYVPTFGGAAVFRDGGPSGDAIVRRIVEGAPAHLTPHGTLFILLMATHTEEGDFERRVRSWLGSESDRYDVVFAVGFTKSPAEQAEQMARLGQHAREAWVDLFERERLKQFAYGALVVRAVGSAGEAITRRCGLDGGTTFGSFDWLLRTVDRARALRTADGLLALKPRISEATKLQVLHEVKDGRLEPSALSLQNGGFPFRCEEQVSTGLVSLLMHCDGTRSLAELWQYLIETDRLASTTTRAEMAQAASYLIERGFALVDD